MASLNPLSWVSNARGWFGGGVGSITPVSDAPKPTEKPAVGIQGGDGTQVQSLGSNGFGFLAGYGECPVFSAEAYLDAIRHPTLTMARAFALNPIKVGKYRFRKWGNISGEKAERIEKMTRPLISGYVRDACWSVDLGWAGFQNVWERAGGRWVLSKIIACKQEANSGVLYDQPTGEYRGVLWNGLELYGHKAFIVTNDRRGQEWLGQSRVRNVLGVVANWHHLNNKSAQLANKAAGIIFGVGFPPGSAKDKDGNVVTREKQASDYARQVVSGAGYFTYPLLGALDETRLLTLIQTKPAEIAAVLKSSLWDHKLLDLGDSGASIGAITDEKRYLDEKICEGYHVAPESILMGAGGNRAKTESQGNSSTSVNEEVNMNIADSLNKGAVRSALQLDDEDPDSCGYEAEPLEDSQPLFDRSILQSIAASDAGMDYLTRTFNIDEIAERNGMSKREDESASVSAMGMTSKFEAAKAARDAGVSEREALRVAGYDNAAANRIMGEKALEDVESMMAQKPQGGNVRAA